MHRDTWLVLNSDNRIMFCSPISVMPVLIPKTDSFLVQYSGYFPPNFNAASCLSFNFQHSQISFNPIAAPPELKVASAKYACMELLRNIVNLRRSRFEKNGWMLTDELHAFKVEEARLFLNTDPSNGLRKYVGTFPYLQLESELRGISQEEAAKYILMRHISSMRALASSERFRMTTLETLKKATSQDDVTKLYNHLYGTLSMLTGQLGRSMKKERE